MPVFDDRRPFTAAQAEAAGITPAMLRTKRFRRMFRGVYINARVPFHPHHQAEAALLTHSANAFASHFSAARVYGLPVPDCCEEHVSVFDVADRRRRDGVVSHLAPSQPVARFRGVPISGPEQLFIDLTPLLSLVDLVVLGDAMVYRELTTVAALVAAGAAWDGKHARAARRAAGFVRAKVESPMESRVRMLIVLAGLPEPEVNFSIRDNAGRELFRLDLSYPDLLIAIEYDGQQHRADLDQWDHDINRGDWLERRHWTRIPVIARGVYRRPDQTIERVVAVLQERAPERLPRRLSDEWRKHFPMR